MFIRKIVASLFTVPRIDNIPFPYARDVSSITPRKYEAYNPDSHWNDPCEYVGFQAIRAENWIGIKSIIYNRIIPLIRPRDTILEIGAGLGFLRRVFGKDLLESVNWVETDKSASALNSPSNYKTNKMLLKLPHFTGINDSSVNMVIGCGVIDTLPYEDVPLTMSEISRILKPGGLFIHFLDVWPCRYPEAEWAASHEMALFPEYHKTDEGKYAAEGFVYCDINKIEKARNDGQLGEYDNLTRRLIEDPVFAAGWFEQYIDVFTLMNCHARFKELGIVVKEEKSFANLFSDILKHYTRQAGFKIKYSGDVVAKEMIPREYVSFLPIPSDVNYIVTRNGLCISFSWNRAVEKSNPGSIYEFFTGQLLVAKKP